MPKFNVPDLAPAKMQALLDADPLYRQHLAAFEGADPRRKPAASIALMDDFNRLVPYEQRLNSRYAAHIGETGRVDVQDRNNPWADPALWGGIAITAASLGAASPYVAGSWFGAGGASAIPTTMGIGSATSLGLPVTAGLGSAGGASAAAAAAGAVPTLASTSTVPATGALVPATTSSLGGHSVGWLQNLKTAYDWYQKGSNAYDGVKGMTGPSPGQSLTQTAGNIEGGRLAALIKQAELQQQQDRLGLERTNAGVNVGNLDLGRRKFAQGVPGQLANDSVRGDVMAGAQDASFSGLPSYIHIPNISGGLRPSLFSGNTRSLGAKMSRDALASSMSGDLTKFPDLPTVPDATPLPEANGTDTALQWAAGAGNILDTLGRFGTKNKSRPQVEPGYQGAGTPGYPGDGVSPDNPMIPPGGGYGPAPAGNPDETATVGMDPSVLEWLRRNGQGAA